MDQGLTVSTVVTVVKTKAQAGHGDAHLQPQHWRSKGRRISIKLCQPDLQSKLQAKATTVSPCLWKIKEEEEGKENRKRKRNKLKQTNKQMPVRKSFTAHFKR